MSNSNKEDELQKGILKGDNGLSLKSNLEFKKLIDVDEETLNKVSTWMYNWWGKRDNYSFEEVKCFMKHSMQKDRLPQTYGLFLDNKIIGIFQFAYEDLSIRPDIYPWLANVYIDEKYRKKGLGRILLENVERMAKENIDFEDIFLYTKHIGLYEKFGWTFVSNIDTFSKTPRIQRLYKLKLK